MIKVFLAHPSSKTAHLTTACHWLARRPAFCAAPLERLVEDPDFMGCVSFRRMTANGRLRTYRARICSTCGRELS